MFYENRLGIKKIVISLFSCFVRIPARNSVNPIIQIARFLTVRWDFDDNPEISLLISSEISLLISFLTVIILNIGTDRSEQTVQTQIRLLLKEQSDQGLLCLLSCLHLLNTILHFKIQLF